MNKKIFCIIFVMILIYINAELTGFEIQLDDNPFEEYSDAHYVQFPTITLLTGMMGMK